MMSHASGGWQRPHPPRINNNHVSIVFQMKLIFHQSKMILVFCGMVSTVLLLQVECCYSWTIRQQPKIVQQSQRLNRHSNSNPNESSISRFVRDHSRTSSRLLVRPINTMLYLSSSNSDNQNYDDDELSFLASSSASKNSDEDDLFMKSLRNRMNEVMKRPDADDANIPIVILDTMLPRQVLKLEISLETDKVLYQLIQQAIMSSKRRNQEQGEKKLPTIGMIGMARTTKRNDDNNNESTIVPLQNGVEVEVEIVDNDGKDTTYDNTNYICVKFRAQRRFRIIGDWKISPQGGWPEARVTYLDSFRDDTIHDDDKSDRISLARAISRANELTLPNMNVNDKDIDYPTSLIDTWLRLARQREHYTGQIDEILNDLGEIPPKEQPSERAFWVGALINPLPGMGVAMEIRPMLLMSKTAEERIGIVITAIYASIRHMDGTKRLF